MVRHRQISAFLRATTLIALVLAICSAGQALGQSSPALEAGTDWSTQAPDVAPDAAQRQDNNTTIIPRALDLQGTKERDGQSAVPVQLVALLTADGQRIDQGIVWRVYRGPSGDQPRASVLHTIRQPAPVTQLPPGDYVVNAAFGRAHLTRRIKVTERPANQPQIETFVLNAGGLRVVTMAGGKPISGSVTFDIYADRDQTDSRHLVMAGAKPGLIIRLNAGLYHIVSTYGDANAVVRSDVTVEAGKLTEATVVHTFGKVSFKLVARAGGEALPDTHWSIQSPDGQVIKETVGALPTHTLAPGRYVVVAKSQGKVFRQEFIVQDGKTKDVEIILQ